MDGTFNGHILVDKLAKLNSSQQSIETLSHWCIFHRKKAKQVVETWDRQFHCSQRAQRVSFLYLANDILQNSRRKGLEFVGEFWKVLPDALNDVFKNGDEFGKNAASRLVDIWEERKVFGSRGQMLKEAMLGRNMENRNRNEEVTSYKLVKNSNLMLTSVSMKQSCGDILEKLISSYERVYDGPVDEDVLFGKCQTAISCIEKVEKEIRSDLGKESLSGPGAAEELQGQQNILSECIEQLIAAESSRTTLVSHLREAITEQETKIEEIRNQLQVAQSQCEQVGNISQHLLSCNTARLPSEERLNETLPAFSDSAPGIAAEAQTVVGDRERLTTVRYIQQGPSVENSDSPYTEEESRKIEAAMVAEKLAASASSAQMLSSVLSSLASEGIIDRSAMEDRSSDSKRPRLEDGSAPYIPPHPQPPLPPFPHPDSLHQTPPQQPSSSSPTTQPGLTMQPPPPWPQITTQFLQATGSTTSMAYTYGSAPPLQRPALMPGYPMVGMPSYSSPPIPQFSFGHPPLPATPSSVFRQ